MSTSVFPIVKLVSVAFLIVVVGVFIGMTMCATLHPPVESFSSCARSNADVDSSKDITPNTKKCIRIVSRPTPPPPPPKLRAPTIVIAPSRQVLSTDLQKTQQERQSACAQDNPTPSTSCPKSVYCPPCPKCPAPCPRMCPDMSKYVLKTSIPPCPVAEVDQDVYMLKSKCKQPDMSKYVLKSKMHSFKNPPRPPRSERKEKSKTAPLSSPSYEASQNKKQKSVRANADKSSSRSSNAEPPSADTKKPQSNGLFGDKNVLDDENMVAWNDMGIGGGGFGASVKESTTFTDSCVK